MKSGKSISFNVNLQKMYVENRVFSQLMQIYVNGKFLHVENQAFPLFSTCVENSGKPKKAGFYVKHSARLPGLICLELSIYAPFLGV